MRTVGTSPTVFSLLLLTAVACGGGGLEQPEPLSQRFDDMHIAAVPIEEKQAVFEANNEWAIAKAERAKVQTELDETLSELEVARNEYEKAKLDEQTAEKKKETADKSNEGSRISEASTAVRGALLNKRAIGKQIEYLEAHKEYLDVKLIWAEQNMYSKEAGYYQAMGKVAQQKNIKPPGVDFGELSSQAKERSESAQRLKALSERERKSSLSARGEWQKAQQAAEEATGG